MSYKDIQKLFDQENSPQTITTEDGVSVTEDLESFDFIKEKNKSKGRYVPNIEFNNPENFAFYGSAREYYEHSFEYIRRTFPYDGSLREKEEWHNEASDLDNYIFDNLYPRKTGYLNFSAGSSGWGSQSTKVTESSGVVIAEPSVKEYVSIKGGPHPDPDCKFKSVYSKANKYDIKALRSTNLDADFDRGVTVEFWYKGPTSNYGGTPTPGYNWPAAATTTGLPVIFDLWNGVTGSDQSYGRFTIFFKNQYTTAAGDGAFVINCVSGSKLDQGIRGFDITGSVYDPTRLAFTTVPSSSVLDGNWHHYAFVARNRLNDLVVSLYMDGHFKQALTASGQALGPITLPLNATSSGMNATIGASIAHPWISPKVEPGTALSPKGAGWNKISGSLDEFRYWKSARNPKQIGRNWFTQVGGGTNDDLSNVDLGVYYKFNESKNTPLGDVVLDYSGRYSNGAFVGFTASMGQRSTGSAMDERGYTEYKDPVIYSQHADYISKKDELIASGNLWDNQNVSSIHSYFPEWILSEDGDIGDLNLKRIAQTMASYLDELTILIKKLPRLKDVEYMSGSFKPQPFSNKKLESLGFNTFDLFRDAEKIERFLDKNEDENFEDKVHNVKNYIYDNIYNNLTSIFKAKGNEKSFKQLLHSLGLDEDIFKINLYSNNTTYELKDGYKYLSRKRRLLDFSRTENNVGTLFQTTSSAAGSLSYITGSPPQTATGFVAMPRTYETNVLFPKQTAMSEPPYKYFSSLSSSIFGVHTHENNSAANIMTWDSKDVTNFQVYAVRHNPNEPRAKFVLTTTDGGMLLGKIPNASSTFQGLAALNADSGTELILRNADGTSVTFTTNSSLDYTATGFYNAIGTQNVTTNARATQALHNAFSAMITKGDLKMTLSPSTYTNETSITLSQNVEGTSGNTTITLPANISANGTTGAGTVDFTGGTKRLNLESDYFNIYDNEKWNLSVALRPTNLETADRVMTGALGHTNDQAYTVEFRGYSANAEVIENKFKLTGTLSTTYGMNILTSSARVYVGAHYTNFTGSIREKSDVRNINTRVWLKYLKDEELEYHIRDIENYGSLDAYRNASIGNKALDNQYVHNFDTLALHWEYSNLTGSDGNGYVAIADVSSGSANRTTDDALYGNALYRKHEGVAMNYQANDENICDVDYIPIARQRLPEILNSADMVTILHQDDDFFPSERAIPIRYLLAIEKSMYQSISEEMINMFATIKEFNNVIGQPVNRYRQEYKSLEKLRQAFFDKVENTPDIEKYVEFYKWFDSSIVRMLQQLIPASTLQIGGVGDTIESHVFERNKYWNKYPTLENKFPLIEGQILGINEQLYDFNCGTAYSGLAAATYVNVINLSGHAMSDQVSVFVPIEAGGDGQVYTIMFTGADATGATSAAAYRLVVGESTSPSDGTVTETLIDMINGHTGTGQGAYGHNFAASGDVAGIGIPGIIATLNGSTGITLTAKVKGRWGNRIVVKDVAGNAVTTGAPSSSPVALQGGSDLLIGEPALWWKDRAERSLVYITSGDAFVNKDREQIRSVLTTKITASAPTFTTISGSKYFGSTYVLRNLSKPYRFEMTRRKLIHGGPNSNDNQHRWDYISPVAKSFGDNSNYLHVSLDIPQTASYDDCTPDIEEKRRLPFMIKRYENGQEIPYHTGKGDLFAPWNIFSSSFSASSDWRAGAFDSGYRPIDISDVHHDVYGDDYEVPMQGPFTEQYVGGKQSRHQDINVDNLDTADTRPEEYTVVIDDRGSGSINIHSPDINGTHRPRAVFMREELAKRPVNIKNILITGSLGANKGTLAGNYFQPYQVMNAVGRDVNNIYLRDTFNYGFTHTSVTEMPWWFRHLEIISSNVSGVMDHNVFERMTSSAGKRNRLVFSERFSAPGGPETAGRGYRDDTSETYSVYNTMNYRNQNVRQSLDTLWTISSGQFGIASVPAGETSATLVDAINLAGITPGHEGTIGSSVRSSVEITVPVEAGGDGQTYEIYLQNTDGNGGTSAMAYRLSVAIYDPAGSGTFPSNSTLAETIVDLINGFTGTGQGTYGHKYAGSGDTLGNGIPGLTATLSTTTVGGYGRCCVTLTATKGGAWGNRIEVRSSKKAGSAIANRDIASINGTNLAGGLSLVPSYHKINRNPNQRLELNSQHAATSGTLLASRDGIDIVASHDNAWVQHPIPRHDFAYSWITASVDHTQPRTGIAITQTAIQRISGHAPYSGYISGTFEAGWNTIAGSTHFLPAIKFLSASQGPALAHVVASASARGVLSEYVNDPFHYSNAPPTSENRIFHPFISLNMITSEPFFTSSITTETIGDQTYTYQYDNLLGHPERDGILDFPGIYNDNPQYFPLDKSYFNNINFATHTRELGYGNSFWPFQIISRPFTQYMGLASNARSQGGILFNGVITERNGPYGWCTWKQIRNHQKPFTKYLRKNNIISVIRKEKQPLGAAANSIDEYKIFKEAPYEIYKPFDIGLIQEGETLVEREIDWVTEPPLTDRYKPFRQYFKVKTLGMDHHAAREKVELKYTHGNNQSTFANNKLNNILHTFNQTPQLYDDLKKFYHSPGSNIIPDGVNPLAKDENTGRPAMLKLSYREKVFPREKYAFLNEARMRTNFENKFWRDKRFSDYLQIYSKPQWYEAAYSIAIEAPDYLQRQFGRTEYNYSGSHAYALSTHLGEDNEIFHQTNSLGAVVTVQSGTTGYVPAANGSIWCLDARAQYAEGYALVQTSSAYNTIYTKASTAVATTIKSRISGGFSGLDGAGELQNDYCLFHNGDLIQSGNGPHAAADNNQSYDYLRGTNGQSAGLRAGSSYARRVPERLDMPRHAQLSQIIDFNGYATNDDMQIFIPKSAGGHGVAIIIRLTAGSSDGSSAAGANVMGVGVGSTPSAGTVAEAVVDAINNTNRYGHSIVHKGSAFSADGILGVRASLYGTDKITLTIEQPGSAGDWAWIGSITGNAAAAGSAKMLFGAGSGKGSDHVIFSGDTAWQAGAQMDMLNIIDKYGHKKCIGPFYDSYEDWAEDLRAVGKGYSILPEYRMSDHMDHYIAAGVYPVKQSDEPVNWLSLTGAHLSDISVRNKDILSEDFVSVYSTSDFLKYFKLLTEEHKSEDGWYPKRISLKCKALKKFLPYEGFYPANRCLQMATLFSRSYGPTMNYAGTQPSFRTATTPFFAPGILYNTIKSGIAVDYPIFKRTTHTAYKDTALALLTDSYQITGSYHNGTSDMGIPRIEYFNDKSGVTNEGYKFPYRVDFDTLINPEKLSDILIIDAEPHPNALIDSTASFKSPASPHYTLAMNNFLATVPYFFLKNNRMGAFVSQPANLWQRFSSDTVYRMFVVLGNNNEVDIMKLEEENPYDYGAYVGTTKQSGFTYNAKGTVTSKRINHSKQLWKNTIRMYDRTDDGPQDDNGDNFSQNTPIRGRHHHGLTTAPKGTGVYDYYGSSFGPPVAISSSYSGSAYHNAHSASYAPFTPPYYNGRAIAVVDFFPPHEGNENYTLSDIFEFSRISYLRDCDSPFMTRDWGNNVFELTLGEQNKSLAARGAMQLDASVNLQGQISDYKPAVYNSFGDITGFSDPPEVTEGTSWVIEPRFECPVLHFDHSKDSEILLPVSGSGSIASGMWHQYSQDFGDPSEDPVTFDDGDGGPIFGGGVDATEAEVKPNRGVFLSILGGLSPWGNPFPNNWSEDSKITLADELPSALIEEKYTNEKLGTKAIYMKDLAQHVGFRVDRELTPKEIEQYSDSTTPEDVFSEIDDMLSSTQVKIGNVANSMEISEAVMAVPFTLSGHGIMQLYTFPKEWVDYTLSNPKNLDLLAGDGDGVTPPWNEGGKIIPSTAVQNQIQKMKKYVLPPHLDFINNTGVTPFVMYIFEFKHTLNRKDLANIWQNLPPKTLMDIGDPLETVDHIDHTLFVNDFFGLNTTGHTFNFPQTDIRWMVFKVKQRAPKNFRAITLDSTDDLLYQKFQSTKYGYNWPYDFFTMLELVQLEAGIDYHPGQQPEPGLEPLFMSSAAADASQGSWHAPFGSGDLPPDEEESGNSMQTMPNQSGWSILSAGQTRLSRISSGMRINELGQLQPAPRRLSSGMRINQAAALDLTKGLDGIKMGRMRQFNLLEDPLAADMKLEAARPTRASRAGVSANSMNSTPVTNNIGFDVSWSQASSSPMVSNFQQAMSQLEALASDKTNLAVGKQMILEAADEYDF